MRTSTSRRLRTLGDVIASVVLIASLRSGERNARYMRDHTSTPIWVRDEAGVPPVGRVLWQLAFAEENFFAGHYRYAPHASDLPIGLPSGFNATVLTGTRRGYQLRLEVTTGPERGTSCLLWGNRIPGRPLDEFQVNCINVRESRGST